MLALQAVGDAGDLFADLPDGFGAAAFAVTHAFVETVGEAVNLGGVELSAFEGLVGDAVGEALDRFVLTALDALGNDADLLADRVDRAGAALFERLHAVVDG